MYIVGDAEMLLAQKQASMWHNVLAQLKQSGRLGSSLELMCVRHPAEITQIRSHLDFARVADGGCTLPCQFKLKCGHACPRLCHPDDAAHAQVRSLLCSSRVLSDRSGSDQINAIKPLRSDQFVTLVSSNRS